MTRWEDLFGMDPDYLEGVPVDEYLDGVHDEMCDPFATTPVQPAKPQEVSVDLNALNSATDADAQPRTGMFHLRRESHSQCAACGRYFTTTANFDKHRVWTGGSDEMNRRRECVNPSTVGLVQGDNDAWRGPSRPGGWSR